MKHPRAFRVLTIAVLLGLGGLPLAHADWPVWRGPNADGKSTETNWNPVALAGGAKVAWQKELGRGYSAVAVRDGRVFTMGNDGKQDSVYCLDAKTGAEVWVFRYACGAGGGYAGPRATPILDGPAVFTVSQDGQLHCLRATDGTVIWKKDLAAEFGATAPKWNHAASPRVEGDLLVLNAGRAGLALKKQTGAKVWGGEAGVCGYASPIPYLAGERPAVAIFGAKALMGIDLATGRQLWAFPWETSHDVNAADPLVVGGSRLFISSGYGRGCAMLDVAGNRPRELWNNKSMSNHFSSSVVIGDHLYGIDGNAGRGHLRCLSVEDGSEKWAHNSGFGGLMAAGDRLIVLNETGQLSIVAASPTGYRELSSAQTPLGRLCWTAPVLANGMIYCRNDKGTLVCVDVSQ